MAKKKQRPSKHVIRRIRLNMELARAKSALRWSWLAARRSAS